MKNDTRIETLKAEVAKKKKALGKKVRFEPITNCVITLRNHNLNINTLDKNDLTVLALDLSSLRKENKSLKLDLSFNGFTVDEWFTDVKSKLDVMIQKEKIKSLELVEKKLTKLLSGEKQTELAIDELESMIS